MEECPENRWMELEEENRRLKNEIEGIQTAANLMHTERDNEVTAIRSQYQKEMDTYKELMKNAVFSQQESERRCQRAESIAKDISNQFEKEKQDMMEMNETLRNQILRQTPTASPRSRLQRLKRSKLSVPNSPLGGGDDSYQSVEQAQEQAKILRAVVAPMEAQIAALKKQLVDAHRSASPLASSNSVVLLPEKSPLSGSRELQQQLAQEKQLRADCDIQLQLKTTEVHVLQSELENFKVAQEREKAMVAELRFSATRAANKYESLLQELQGKCAALERQANVDGQQQGPRTASQAETTEATESSCEAQESVDERVKLLNELRASLLEESDRERQHYAEQWKLQHGQYEAEIKTLQGVVDANQKRIETLNETVAELNRQVLQPCAYCADYEYKVVRMQEQVQATNNDMERTQAAVDEAIADVQQRVDVVTLTGAAHLKRSLDHLEQKLLAERHTALVVVDEQSKANVRVIHEALALQEAACAALEQEVYNTRKKFNAIAQTVAVLKQTVTEKNQCISRMEAANQRLTASLSKSHDTITAEAEAREQNMAVMSALQEQLAEARGTRTQKLPRRLQQVHPAATMSQSQQPRQRSQSASAGSSKKRPTLTKTSANVGASAYRSEAAGKNRKEKGGAAASKQGSAQATTSAPADAAGASPTCNRRVSYTRKALV
eukprot:m.639545 g.639545  ORF g.639545 m.639545 type:complete len:670 (-) comp22616_c0_seq8:1683-3692(-)